MVRRAATAGRLVVLVALLASALTAGATWSPPAGAAGGGTVDLTGAVSPTWTVRPGVELAAVTGAGAHVPLTIVDETNERLLTLITDDLGQANFAYIPDDYLVFQTGTNDPFPTSNGLTLRPGTYRIVDESASPMQASEPFVVLGVDDHPPTSLYGGQSIGVGFNYVTVRDGVTLSVMVRYPDPLLYGTTGPFPTVIEYSGYGPSNPNSPEPGQKIANLLGFATVGVNIRGSGCSGGVFDIFTAAQSADGYDVIETIARQPWVLHNQVGMIGLSYSGITQLYVASTRPPSLSAITPLSVIEDPWYEQWPGGIYNSGFTKQWLAQRDAQNSAGGTDWVRQRIASGDTTCAANQDLHEQNPDFEQFGRSLEFRPADADGRKLSLLVRNINVPVYLTGAWQDEQTGSRFAIMLDDFVNAPTKKFTLFNGRHPDGYTPLVLTRWWEFLEMYVKKVVPHMHPAVRLYSPPELTKEFRAPNLKFESDRFWPRFGPSQYAAARAWYEAEPQVRVLFENGAGDPTTPGSPKATFEASFPSWPPPTSTNTELYLNTGGTLASSPSVNQSIDQFAFDPAAGPLSYSNSYSYDFLYPQIQADWQRFAQGKGLSYTSPPLAQDMVVAGFGYLDLWMRSTATDADLEVVVSEIYPDGNEVWVQNGLLRAGDRSVNVAESSGNYIEHNYDLANYQPLTPGQFEHFQIPLYSVAHPFRAGSRIRVMIDTAGRDMPLWQFENPAFGADPVLDDVARGGAMPSKLVLPVVSGITVPATRPACNALRGQVCRPSEDVANTVILNEQPPPANPSITGTVSNDVGGAPLEGMAVGLYPAAGTGRLAKTTTAADGTYAFADLAAGSYRLKVWDPAGSFLTEWNADQTRWDAATDVTANAGPATTVDIGLRPGAARIQGRVRDRNAPGVTPLAGATVTLYDEAGSVVAVDTTGPSGWYDFPSLDPGAYKLRFTKAGYFTEWHQDAWLAAKAGIITLAESQWVTLDGYPNEDFLTRTANPEISGTVTAQVGGAPIAGASVRLYTASGQVSSTATNASGQYSFGGLAKHVDYFVRFEKAGFTPEWFDESGPWFDDCGGVPGPCTPTEHLADALVYLGGGVFTGIDGTLS